MCGPGPCRCNPCYVVAALGLTWALVILGSALAKFNGFETEEETGAEMFLEHWTNWVWLWQGLFYLATVPFIVPAAPGRWCDVQCAGWIAGCCFLPLLAAVVFVAVAVLLLLMSDPEFITDLFAAMGAGVVIIGNDVFHWWPVLAITLFGAVHGHLIWYGLNRWFRPLHAIDDATGRRIALCCATWYQVGGGLLLVAVVYLLVLWAAFGKTVGEVYGTELPVWLGLGLILTVALLVAGTPLLILVLCYGLWEPPPDEGLAERLVYTPPGQLPEYAMLLAYFNAQRAKAMAAPKTPPAAAKARVTFSI